MKRSKKQLQQEIMEMVHLPRTRDGEREFSKKELFHLHCWIMQHDLLVNELRDRVRVIERKSRADR